MKKNLLLFLVLVSVQTAFAQGDSAAVKPKERLFKHNFQAGFTLNQSSFSDNWKGGGVSSFAFGWFLNYNAKHHTDNWDFNSDLQMQLGYQDNKGEKRRKNADRLFYDLKAGYILNSHWNVFGSLNFLSQFKDGFDYKTKSSVDATMDSLISTFMAPAYITTSVGLEYKPLNYIWMRLGIGTLRQTVVLDKSISNAQLYGLEKPGDKIRNQFVLQYIFNFDKDLAKNVNFKTRYMVNYDYFKNGKPNAFVHILNANLTLKATKYISTNFQVNLINDYDQSHTMQWSQILSLGMIYSLSSK
ncbi:MAG: hypothetical protein CFE21_07140 [Bacteroidetes bacterium B1(2017)]|nr:MAG: hypothetical protein CFE21_07140 [Bacteroidetes bacterium B1(2017)]